MITTVAATPRLHTHTTTTHTTVATTASLLVALLALGAAGCADRSTTATKPTTTALPTSAPVIVAQGKGGSGSGKSPDSALPTPTPAKGWPRDGEVIDCTGGPEELYRMYDKDVLYYRDEISVQLVKITSKVKSIKDYGRQLGHYNTIQMITVTAIDGKVERDIECNFEDAKQVKIGDQVTISGRVYYKSEMAKKISRDLSMYRCQLSPR